ncbi:MAG: hypothetical protein ACE5Q6_26920 [Dehalococcoidia bacterium]
MTIGERIPRGEIVEECDAMFEVFDLPTDEGTLLAILKDCFEEWEHIHIGPLIPGAIWEIRPPHKPSITMRDGYATVDFQDWHFHICIGEHKGAHPEIAKLRRTGRVELYRRLSRDEQPTSWRLRFLNGAGDQQITFMLPSPLLTDDLQIMEEPDWARLALWDRLRRRYLGIGSDHLDRTARRLSHG